MTIAHCKEALSKLLQDKSLRVIALSGEWGTGKTYLWNDIKKGSTDALIPQAIKVSLFGVRSIADLKMRFIQEHLEMSGGAAKAVKAVKDYIPGVQAIAKMISSRFSALDEALLVLAPAVFSNRLLVLDDIERRQSELKIDEVLGFIDDCAWSRGCKVLLILNSDQLKERDVWETFREKVIDYEIRLDTSPKEAFDIAIGLHPSPHASLIKRACVICGITNIRVLSKIIGAANRVLEGHDSLTDQTANRMIPSIVLLSAVYYRGMKDAPPLEFVLGLGSSDLRTIREAAARQKRKDEPTEEDGKRAKWMMLLTRLNILGVDDFEPLVVDFLKSGLLENGDIKAVVQRYTSEEHATSARLSAETLVQHYLWHPELSDSELLSEAKAILPEVPRLAPGTVTLLHGVVSEIKGGSELAEAMIDACIEQLRREAPEYPLRFETIMDGLHPRIRQEYEALAKRSLEKRSLPSVIQSIVEKSGWGEEENSVMRSASPGDFESAIQGLTGEDLKLFLLKNIEFYVSRGQYQQHFGSAMDNFLAACQSLANKNDRLALVIRGAFVRANLGSVLGDGATTESEPKAQMGTIVLGGGSTA
jgi:hypothetical protein